jgi:replicative DNA helicase
VPTSLPGAGKARLAARLRKLRTRARFLIKEFPTSTLSVAGLNAYLDSLAKVHRFVPDVLLIDYPDLMAVDSRNLRTDLGVIYKQIRGVAVKRNLALATVTQGTRQSTQSRVVSENMVAEDFSKVATADTILTYSQTPEEKKLGLARIMVANARDAEDKYIVLVSQNYATGQFCIDSAFMSHVLSSELDRLTGTEKPAMDGEDREG